MNLYKICIIFWRAQRAKAYEKMFDMIFSASPTSNVNYHHAPSETGTHSVPPYSNHISTSGLNLFHHFLATSRRLHTVVRLLHWKEQVVLIEKVKGTWQVSLLLIIVSLMKRDFLSHETYSRKAEKKQINATICIIHVLVSHIQRTVPWF